MVAFYELVAVTDAGFAAGGKINEQYWLDDVQIPVRAAYAAIQRLAGCDSSVLHDASAHEAAAELKKQVQRSKGCPFGPPASMLASR